MLHPMNRSGTVATQSLKQEGRRCICLAMKALQATNLLFCAFSVRSGVDHFKHGRHVEAMNEYNKALDIDTNNVEALVARGAL